MARTYPALPFVGVGAVVFKAERVLLVQRGTPPRLGEWSLPGGAQKTGETYVEAARREVHQETGVEIDILGLIDVVDSIMRDEAGAVQYHYTLVDYAAVWRAGRLAPGDDAADARWIPFAAIEEWVRWDETLRILRAAHDMWTRAGAGER